MKSELNTSCKVVVHGVITSLIRFNLTTSVSAQFSDLTNLHAALILSFQLSAEEQQEAKSKRRDNHRDRISANFFVINVPWNIYAVIESVDEVEQPIGLFNRANLSLSPLLFMYASLFVTNV